MSETLIVGGFFISAISIGLAAFIILALNELLRSKRTDRKPKFETDHPVVITVERLGKFVTIFFYTLWTWLILGDFIQERSSEVQTYLRIGLLMLHLAIASYMLIRSILAVASTGTDAELVHAIGAKNSRWEKLEDTLLTLAMWAAILGSVIGIYFLATNQA